jgi:sugar/nucleoside kinase (ribokinase family)
MLYGLDRKWALADCLRFASAAGCLKCQYLGATSRVPTVLEIQSHIRENLGVAAQYGPM